MSTRISVIKARLAKATPGPWRYERVEFIDGSFAYETHHTNGLIQISEFNYDDKLLRAKWDAELIFNAPSDIAWLLSEIARKDEALRIYADDSITHHFEPPPAIYAQKALEDREEKA